MDKSELIDLEEQLAEAIGELAPLGDYDTNAKRIRNLYVALYAVVRHLREKARK